MQEQLTVQFILVLVTQSTLAAVDYIRKLDKGQCNIVKEPSQWYPRPVAIHVGHQCYPFVPDDGSTDNVYFPDQSDVCCSCDYDKPTTFPRPSSLWSESPIGTELAETPFTSSLISDHTPSGHVSEVSTPIWGGNSLQPGGSPESSTPSWVVGTTQFLGGPEGEGVSGLTNVMGTESSTSTHEETSTMLPGGVASQGNGSSTIPSVIEGSSIESSTLAHEETSTVLPGGTESGIPGGYPEVSTQNLLEESTLISENVSITTPSALEEVSGLPTTQSNLTSTGTLTHEETSTVLPGGAASQGNGSSTIPSIIEGPSIESSTLAHEETSTVLPGGTESGIPGGYPEVSTQNLLEESTLISENVSITTPSALEEVSGLPTTQSNLTSTGTLTHEETSTVLPGGAASQGNGSSTIPSIIEGPSIESSTLAHEETSTVLPGGTESGIPGGYPEVSTQNSLEESTLISENVSITTPSALEEVSGLPTTQSNLTSTGIESAVPTQEGPSSVLPIGATGEPGTPGFSTPSSLEGSTGFSVNTLYTLSTSSEAITEPVTPLTNPPGTGVESSTPLQEEASTVQPGGSESEMPGGFSENPLEGYTGISGTTSEGEPGSNLSSTGIESTTPIPEEGSTVSALGTAGAGGLPESSTPTESQPASSSGFESNLTTSGLPGTGTESSISPGENPTGSTGEGGSESTEIPGTGGLGSTENPATLSIVDRIQNLIKDIEKNKCTTDEQF